MNRTLIVMLLSGAAIAANANPQDGFKGPDNTRHATTLEVANLDDDANVKLEGYIVKSLGDEKYEFQDDTGTLIVEIDDDDWNGLEVTPELRIVIGGEIDKDWQSTELDVDWVHAAQ